MLGLPGAGLVAHLFGAKIGGTVADVLKGQVGTRAAEVGSRIARAASVVAGSAERGAPATVGRIGALSPSAFAAVRDNVLEAAADPQAFRSQVDAQLDGLRPADPALAQQVGDVHQVAAQHLAQVAPRAMGAPTLADQSGTVSKLEQDKFLRRVDVVLDPTVLLDHLEAGTLTPSMVETGDAVYAPFMSMLRSRLIEAMQGKPVATGRRLALSMLLGAPVTGSMQPEHIAAAQARMQQEMLNVANPPRPASAPAPEPLTPGQRAGDRDWGR
jgi:hypothetical protein